eukprot:ANDGO_07658.mRNA.1 hypothetical protein
MEKAQLLQSAQTDQPVGSSHADENYQSKDDGKDGAGDVVMVGKEEEKHEEHEESGGARMQKKRRQQGRRGDEGSANKKRRVAVFQALANRDYEKDCQFLLQLFSHWIKQSRI